MRSVVSDLTGKAAIRDAALALFAERGADAVSVRQIAAAAEVSPALILHHFGSKEGLRQAVSDHVVALIDQVTMSQSPTDVQALVAGDVTAADSLTATMAAAFPSDSPVLPYLRRLLLANDDVSHAVVKHWYDLTVAVLTEWQRLGIIDPGPDIPLRAAFMLTADLGALLLRDHMSGLVGTDLMTAEGLRRWTAESVRVYSPMFTP
ncbi:MAG TPA: TetR family transcriptional regulator [Ornithinimicrobium sp.]|uniref:TetR/AcrR family transcriptional regulator n=1 Tax=Ornithinimicrobium sp. TaxID=1977084 RepID=UPI002B487F79|nr:TetR family transcriptional regulator [Ornithinimicrobium sp.]HKJ12792.1 TetR family transcriptional regulator [Ornithinimicrobium sp.]